MTSESNYAARHSSKAGAGFFAAAFAVTLAVTLAFVVGCASVDSRIYGLKLEVLSSPSPHWVSGGDALVRINGNIPPIAKLRVTLNGRDVTAAFATGASGGKPTGLLTGMALGKNLLIADLQLPGESVASATSALELTNHPAGGPMFSGPQQMPFACQTDSFLLADGKTMLGAPLDANCSIATRVDYVYRNTAAKPDFVPLPSLTTLPGDVATTTTNTGKTVPYIVRVETGTLNRRFTRRRCCTTPPLTPPPATRHRPPAGMAAWYTPLAAAAPAAGTARAIPPGACWTTTSSSRVTPWRRAA